MFIDSLALMLAFYCNNRWPQLFRICERCIRKLGYNTNWQKERRLTKEKMQRPTTMTMEHAWHGLCPAAELHKPFSLFSKKNLIIRIPSIYPDGLWSQLIRISGVLL